MTIPDRYDAYWIPGPDDLDTDAGLERGYQWLDETPHPGQRVVLLQANSMLNNRPTLARASRYHVTSPKSSNIPHGNRGPVLAIWSDDALLELAMQLALDSALCVIPNRHDITWWLARTHAINLTEPDAPAAALATLDPPIADALDSILRFGGHNDFVGGGEKDETVRELRAMVAAGHRPDPQGVEDYVLASGETGVDGARRLRAWYDQVLSGRQLRGHDRRSI